MRLTSTVALLARSVIATTVAALPVGPIVAAEGFPAQGRPGPAPASRQATDGSRVVILNSQSFNIPFRVDAATTQPVQVQLYVSRGPESPWELLDRQPPTVREFRFTGQEDGVFWFATRTVDAAGQPFPPGPIRPQLKVLVDTSVPQLELEADTDESGRVQLELRIDDATPVRAIEAQYATDTRPQWRPLDGENLRQRGSVSFEPDEGWRELHLHVVATDSAGNQSVTTRRLQRPRVAASAAPKLAAAPQPVAPLTRDAGFRTVRPASSPLPPAATPEQISRGRVEGLDLEGPAQAVAPAPSVDGESMPTGQRPQTAAEALRPLEEELPPADQPSPQARAQRETVTTEARPPLRANVEMIPLPENATPEPYAARRSDQEAAGADPAGRRATVDLEALRSQVPVRFSDSERFSLEYELESVGSRGVEAVELWGTLDGGETWKRWGTDPDRTSPFDIETVGEGIFGYRSVVVGANGLVSPSPLSGDLPDIAIVVDSTPPDVQLTSVRYGEGDRVGSLVIRYECADTYLRERPIALSFSDSPDGPWTTIAAGLRNEGEYVWPADPELPRQIYLRIDATDQAGNVGTDRLDRPVDAQGLAPRARIRGFRSLGAGFFNPEPGEPASRTARAPSRQR